MRILIVSPHFSPETGAVPNRINSMLERFVASGHEVAVITSKPHHPEGSIWPEYRGRLFEKRTVSGVPVVYAWLYARPKKTFLTRILTYVSFMVTAVLASTRLDGRFDVVLANSPPLFVGISGWLVGLLKRGRFVFDVRDLWPDVAVAMGELNGTAIVRLAEGLERFIYNRADGITAVTSGFEREIRNKIDNGTPTATIPNGALRIFLENEWSSEMRAEYNLENRFAILFAGNIGLAQGLPHVIDAAEILADVRPEALFLFVGSGPALQTLMDAVETRGLKNVVFHPRIPLETAASLMASADALLVPLAKDDIYKMFVPSKLFDSLASGRPVLLSVPGIAREILEASRGGRWYPAEDSTALAEVLVELMDDPSVAKQLGINGRSYARENLMRETQAQRMEEFLEQVLERNNQRVRAVTQ
ncbi:MAG: glycosyltransferase family 4 protein [Rhodothermia bacterium]|nr:glycosyltransferase family 4 protein [Rhodothermia bacterium]